MKEVRTRVDRRVQACAALRRDRRVVGVQVAVATVVDSDRIDADVGPSVEGLSSEPVQAVDRDAQATILVRAIGDRVHAQLVPAAARRLQVGLPSIHTGWMPLPLGRPGSLGVTA